MFCDVCRKNASFIYFVRVLNNKVIRTNLCEDCFKNLWKDMTFKPLSEIFEGLKPAETKPAPRGGLVGKEVTCKNCSTKLSSYFKEGFLGCSECYKAFAPALRETLKESYGDVVYGGKIPKGLAETTKIGIKLHKLRRKLKLYIKEEEYEKAADTRDEIINLEKQLTLR